MNSKWFANNGQIVQMVAAIVSAAVAVIALYFVLKSNNSLPKASIVLYVSASIFLLLVGIFIGRWSKSSAVSLTTVSTENSSSSVAVPRQAKADLDNGPMLEFVRSDCAPVDANHKIRVEDIGSYLLTVTFRNQRLGVGRATPTAYQVHAQLTFRSGQEEVCVHHGQWIREYTHFAEFGPGESRILVVALLNRNGFLYTLENHNAVDPRARRIRSGVTFLHAPNTVFVPNDANSVEIALLSGETTLYERDFALLRQLDGAVPLGIKDDKS